MKLGMLFRYKGEAVGPRQLGGDEPTEEPGEPQVRDELSALETDAG